MKKEGGFIILEVLTLSFVAIGLLGIMYSYAAAVCAEETIKSRAVALYLAKEQMTLMDEKRRLEGLSEERYSFLGRGEVSGYDVFADVEQYEANPEFVRVKVKARWKIFQKNRELLLERIMLNKAE